MGKTYRRQSLSLFDDVHPVQTRVKSKMPKLVRRDGTPTCCDQCDQNAEYILNGTAVCKDCGNKSIEMWNSIIKGEA